MNLKPIIWLVICLLASPLQAQDTPAEPAECPAIIQTAIRFTELRCENTGSNQVCYGHFVLDAEPRSRIVPFDFTEPGDIVDVVEVQSLRLSAMDTATGQWGLVTMRIDAVLADNTSGLQEGDTVQILLFGDTTLTDVNQFVTATVNASANIRRQPSAASPVIQSLPAGEIVTLSGRLEDNRWFRVRLPGQDTAGWLASDLVTPDGAVDLLAVIDPAAPDAVSTSADYGPMQAFLFQSGDQDSLCPEAPNSGLLIQTPEGVASVSIWMDEVVIQMNATAFITAQPGGDLTVNVLEGVAQVEARGETRTVIAGTQVQVPLDENLIASDVPGDPQPYAADDVRSLPLELLDDPVTVAEPLVITSGVPLSGDWLFQWGVASQTCPDGTVVPFESVGIPGRLDVDDGRFTWGGIPYRAIAPDVYAASYTDASGNLHRDTLTVSGFDYMIGEKLLDLTTPVCTLTVPFTLRLVAP